MDDVQQNVTLVFKVTSVCLDAPSVNNFDRLPKAGSDDVTLIVRILWLCTKQILIGNVNVAYEVVSK